jgi:hypothetical protein
MQSKIKRTIKSRIWWAKTPHKPQKRPENAENQPDFSSLLKEKITKNNRPENRRKGQRRVELASLFKPAARDSPATSKSGS